MDLAQISHDVMRERLGAFNQSLQAPVPYTPSNYPPQTQIGLANAGVIPGKVNPTVADDVTINAKKGEYILPQEVTDAIGIQNLDRLVLDIKKQLGLPQHIGPKSHDQPDSQGRMDKPGLPDVVGRSFGGINDLRGAGDGVTYEKVATAQDVVDKGGNPLSAAWQGVKNVLDPNVSDGLRKNVTPEAQQHQFEQQHITGMQENVASLPNAVGIPVKVDIPKMQASAAAPLSAAVKPSAQLATPAADPAAEPAAAADPTQERNTKLSALFGADKTGQAREGAAAPGGDTMLLGGAGARSYQTPTFSPEVWQSLGITDPALMAKNNWGKGSANERMALRSAGLGDVSSTLTHYKADQVNPNTGDLNTGLTAVSAGRMNNASDVGKTYDQQVARAKEFNSPANQIARANAERSYFLSKGGEYGKKGIAGIDAQVAALTTQQDLADKQLGIQTTADAQKYGADQTYKGHKITAEMGLEGQKYTADAGVVKAKKAAIEKGNEQNQKDIKNRVDHYHKLFSNMHLSPSDRGRIQEYAANQAAVDSQPDKMFAMYGRAGRQGVALPALFKPLYEKALADARTKYPNESQAQEVAASHVYGIAQSKGVNGLPLLNASSIQNRPTKIEGE